MLSILVVVATPCAGLAAERQFAVIAGVGTSDNIGRTATAEEDETIASIGTQFLLQYQSRRTDAELSGDLAWLDYLDGTYRSEVTGFAGGALRASLIENILSWSVIDRFGQAGRDLLAAPTPANREHVNQFTTGPDLAFSLASNLDLHLSSRYMRVDYEESPLDTQRFMQSVGLQRALSSGASLGLNASVQRIDPEEASIYQVDEVVLAYGMAGARTELELEAGATRMHGKGRDRESGALLRVELSRQFGRRSTLTLRGGREITDAGGSLGGWQGDGLPQGVGDALGLTQTSDPFISDSARLSWRIEGRITTLEFGGAWVREDLPGTNTLDRRERQLRFSGSRQLGAKLRAGVEYRHTGRDVGPLDGSKEDLIAANLAWRVGRRLSMTAEGESSWFERDLLPGSVRENRFWLRMRYDNAAL